MNKIEQKLLQELARYKSINKYVNEQAAPPPTAPADDASGEAAPMDAAGTPPPPADTSTSPAPDNGTPPPPGEAASPAPMADDLPQAGDDEKIDVTDLVNMTKELKQKVEQGQSSNQDAIHKMDSIFSKLDDLANQLSQMDAVVAKIDDLEKKVTEIKPLTPEEKLNLRSYDSYPFSQKLSDFFADKKPEMDLTRKNTYVLTQDDAKGFPSDIAKSFDV
jgi:polyhydroxyalkanoate synthesis regulator phasin